MADKVLDKAVILEVVKSSKAYSDLLTQSAKEFLTELHLKFNLKRLSLLENRVLQQAKFDKGEIPNFPVETEFVRKGDWIAASIPEDLQDRRVEITGPVSCKMIINALNSGAKTFMADFEDSTSPTWENIMEGQKNLIEAVNKTISFFDSKREKQYELNGEIATLLVRPRGLHLNESHLLVDGEEMSASLVDFGLYMFHNAKELISQGTGPYFYLPKLEHYQEARWWNEVFDFAQDYLNIPKGTIKATVLIETITASFQLDEIIYELKDHIAGLNCGRWDYIFSYIKKLRNHNEIVIPNRDQVTMTTPFMSAYSNLVIQRCHKRNIHAIGGMAAQIPIKGNEVKNEKAFHKVRLDKEREAKNGHDGTWVAHPGLVHVAMEVFNTYMPNANQIELKKETLIVTQKDLLEVPKGTVTEEGIRKNINVSILYLASWLDGNGAVALYHLMEDAATAEISRTQLWHWLHSKVELENGGILNSELFERLFNDELNKIRDYLGEDKFESGHYKLAAELLKSLVISEDFEEFLTLPAYKYL